MSIPYDKSIHIIMGATVALIACFGSDYLDFGWVESFLIAMLATIVLAIGKEYSDSRDPLNHSVELWDVIATIAGGLIGVIFYIVFKTFNFGN